MLRTLPQIIFPQVSSKMVLEMTKLLKVRRTCFLSSSLSSWTFFDESHASLRAHRSCCKVSSCFYPRILEFQDFAREVHTSEDLLAMDPLPQLLRGEAYLLRNARCALIPGILCSSPKSTWISAAQNPGNTQPPSASNDSMSQQILFHHFSLAFCWADCQPQCA